MDGVDCMLWMGGLNIPNHIIPITIAIPNSCLSDKYNPLRKIS